MTSYPFSGIASRWLYPNKEVAYFADAGTQYDPFSLSDGVLTITANAVPASSNPVSLPFISGVITTKKMFAQQYGYFEARLKVPAGQGLWPAFWMLPATDTTKTTAELDVLEVLGSNPYQLFSTTHDYLATSNGTSQKLFTVSDMSADFHTYGVDWEPTSVSFYMDGYLLGSTATPSSMNSPMYLLLNLAVGGTGSWPGPALSTLTSAQYQIDYVRAYATANTINVSGSGVLSSADAANVAMPTFLTPPPGVTPGADPNSAVVSGTVQHIGQGDPGTAQAGVTVQILDINGRVLKTTVTDRTGAFSFPGRATGYYSLVFLPPSGEAVGTGGIADPTTGATAKFFLAPAGSFSAGLNYVVSTSHAFSLGDHETGVRGDGDYTVTGAGNGAKLTLGNGNQTVTLGNWANIITVGNGTSTISAGLGYTTVTAGSGNVTISAHGNGNTFDAGPGTNTMTVDTGTVRNVFKLNGAGQGLTTINGFALNNNDTLNVTRSLAGTNIAANLNNIGSFITATSDQTGTTLYVDPTGGSGTPIAFAFLSNVSVTVSQLVAKGVFSISS